jgi:hypothetical protein
MKETPGRARCKWKYDITMDLETGWTDAEWFNMAQDREKWWERLNTATKPRGCIKQYKFLDYLKKY